MKLPPLIFDSTVRPDRAESTPGENRAARRRKTTASGPKRRSLLIAVAGVLATAALTACGPEPIPGVPNSESAILLLASATANEPGPTLTPYVRGLLTSAANDTPASDGLDAAGATLTVATVDLQTHLTLPLTPRRNTGHVEYGAQRDKLITDNVENAEQVATGLAGQSGPLDLLEGIAQNVRGVPPGTLVILSNGLSTAGGFDLRLVGWYATPEEIVTELRDLRLLPDLTGWQVVFSGLGATAGPQDPLPAPARDTLNGYWLAICEASQAASCEIDDSRLPATPPLSTGPAPTVPIEGIHSIVGPTGQTTTTLSDAVLGFAADSSVLGPAAQDVLMQTAARINVVLADQRHTPVIVHGWTADPIGSTPEGLIALSRARAQAVADALASYGVTNPIQPIGGGAAPDMTANVDGQFDEAIAAQMRRSEITF